MRHSPHATQLFDHRGSKPKNNANNNKKSPSTLKRKAAKPNWDDSIHDLSKYKLSKDQLLERKKSIQSKNLEIARKELENGPPKRKEENKTTSPPRPMSAPPRTRIVKTVSPLITKVNNEEPLQEESESIDPFLIIDDEQLHSFSEDIEKLNEEHGTILSRMNNLEYESQIQQGKEQILKLETKQGQLIEKIEQLEISLACTKGENERIAKQFEEYKLESDRIQAELRAQIKKLKENLANRGSLPSLSSRIFQIEQKHSPNDYLQDIENVNPTDNKDIDAKKKELRASPTSIFRTPPKPIYSFGIASPSFMETYHSSGIVINCHRFKTSGEARSASIFNI